MSGAKKISVDETRDEQEISSREIEKINEGKIEHLANMYMIIDGLIPTWGAIKQHKVKKQLSFLNKNERKKTTRKARKVRKKALKMFIRHPCQFPKHNDSNNIRKAKNILSGKDKDEFRYHNFSKSIMREMYKRKAKQSLSLK